MEWTTCSVEVAVVLIHSVFATTRTTTAAAGQCNTAWEAAYCLHTLVALSMCYINSVNSAIAEEEMADS